MKLNLSYIVVTKNKLPMLKWSLEFLIANRKQDEEIIVIDGLSDDGTPEYLKQLKSTNQINKYISESDNNESHAWNKGILLAEGELIKLISDDDIFFYESIDICKKFMLENFDSDVLIGGTYNVVYGDIQSIRYLESDFTNFIKYVNVKSPFACCGLSLMLRRRNISKYGLFSTMSIAPDTDIMLRMTRLNTSIVFYNNPVCIRVENWASHFNVETSYHFYEEYIFLKYALRTTTFSRHLWSYVQNKLKNMVRRQLLAFFPRKTQGIKIQTLYDPEFLNNVKEIVNSKVQSSNDNFFLKSN